jgi:hypothetical protein
LGINLGSLDDRVTVRTARSEFLFEPKRKLERS